MEGGEFWANTRGLDHYREFGYKGALAAKSGAGGEPNLDMQSSAWLRVPYRFNRGLVYDGDLPHLSTKIKALPDGLRRVILGFNLFTHEVGPCAERAPEHSPKFNSTVKLYQTMASARQATTDKEKITVADIKKNPGLYRLLKVVAKKMKERDAAAAASATSPEAQNEVRQK